MMSRRTRRALMFCLSISSATFSAFTSVHAAMSTPGQFAVSESGAATYTIPISVPPGTSGIEPKLALSYSSQGGNGQMGLGWGLSGFSAVTRCTQTIAQDGVFRGIDYEANDRYCLDGQRLISVNGAYGANGTEYRTEMESFSKIISYGVAGNGPASFKVWTKSGQIMEYGNTVDSRIEAQGKTTVRVWAMNKLQDTKGNYLTFTYLEDNVKGNYYPTRVDYTGNANTATPTFNSVQISYVTKPDPSSVYVGGSLISNAVRLDKIQTYSGASLRSEYRVTYNPALTTSSQITSITQCDGAGACLPATQFAWQAGVVTGGRWLANLDRNPGLVLSTGDANGDGLADLLAYNWVNGVITIAYSDGKKLSNWVYVGVATPVNLDPDAGYYPVALGDVNGDGKADIVGGDSKVWLSNGSGFNAPTKWSNILPGARISLGDVNGDGYADMLLVRSEGIALAYSTGSGFGTPISVVPPRPLSCNAVVSSISPLSSSDTKKTKVPSKPMSIGVGNPEMCDATLGDLNGDGLADVLRVDGSVWLSNGNSFLPWQLWGIYVDYYGMLLTVSDINGDGYGDALGISADKYFSATSDGHAFASGSSGPRPPLDEFSPARVDCTYGDVDGDGRGDTICADGEVYLGQNRTPDLITTITSGIGATSTITYKPLTDSSVYTPSTGSAFPIRDVKQQGPIYVVSQVASSNGIGGTLTTNYTYGGMKVDVKGRGALGFQWMQETQANTNITTKTNYRQDWPFIGLPASSTKSLAGQGNAGVLKQVNNTYDCKDFVSASGCVSVVGRRYFTFNNSSVETSWDLNGAALPTVTTTSQLDAWGNATQMTVSTSDGYSKTTTNTYVNDAVNWFLGRLTNATVTSTTP